MADTQKAHDVLAFILGKQTQNVKIEETDHTTYTFFTWDNTTVALLHNKTDEYRAVSIFGKDYSAVSNLEALIEAVSLKSQIAWDLLESSGIRQKSFDLLYKGKIPNQDALAGIDFKDIR
jgi:hypothetical protein